MADILGDLKKQRDDVAKKYADPNIKGQEHLDLRAEMLRLERAIDSLLTTPHEREKDTVEEPEKVIDKLKKQRQQKAEETKRQEEEAKKFSREHPEAREQFKQIREQVRGTPAKQANKVGAVAKDVVKDITTAPKKAVGQAKSSSEKLADIALKEAQRAQQQARNPQIPRIAKDTATEIVIASIVAIFLIQAGAGTKFAELWSLAFSPTKKGKGPTDYTGQGPGGLPDESWDLPTSFHGLIA